jgi:LCP family protein required for cell wall assembly
VPGEEGSRMRFLPRTQGGLLCRALLGAFLVVGFTAGAVSVAALLQVNTIARYFQPGAEHIAGVTLPRPGKPETILIIGSDHRKGEPYKQSETDTMLLVRLNDSSATVNLMSIPRDLEVSGPGGESVKLNAIYEYENGPSGLIRALRQQVFGPSFQVNHVLDVNFTGFSDLVDAIGCVYADIDHRYYNVSQPASSADNYSSIDIQPGYQRLCGNGDSTSGDGALAFVRFRHTDSDEVRNARQQDFIRWARDNYTTSQLYSQKNQLLSIFGKHTTVDTSFASDDGLIDLFYLVINANALSIKSVQFPEYFGACGTGSQTPCYVYPCPELDTCSGYPGPAPPLGQPTLATREIWQQFIKPTVLKPTQAPVPTHRPKKLVRRTVNLSGLDADPGDGASQAAKLGNAGLPVYYPKYIYPGVDGVSETYCYSLTANCDNPDEDETAYTGSYPRRYTIFGPNRAPYKSYVMVLCVSSGVGEYYTIQGTTWKNPPILRKPSRRYRLHGRTLLEYDDGGKISLVAFRTPHGSYWVSNTLDNAIPNGQMVSMAAEMTPYVGTS